MVILILMYKYIFVDAIKYEFNEGFWGFIALFCVLDDLLLS